MLSCLPLTKKLKSTRETLDKNVLLTKLILGFFGTDLPYTRDEWHNIFRFSVDDFCTNIEYSTSPQAAKAKWVFKSVKTHSLSLLQVVLA